MSTNKEGWELIEKTLLAAQGRQAGQVERGPAEEDVLFRGAEGSEAVRKSTSSSAGPRST